MPLTLGLVLLLLYMNTRSMAKTLIIILAVPFSAVGAIWLLYALGYNMSIGVWVGLIALLGVDAETGVFMLLYLDLAYEEARRDGRLTSYAGLQAAVLQGAVKRIRPKFMTVATMFLGLAPIMWSVGTGADVMRAHRRADDWRDLHVVHSGARRVSRPLRSVALALRPQAGIGPRRLDLEVPVQRFFVLCIVFATAAALSAQTPTASKNYSGVISETMCGINHTPMGITPDPKCIVECVKHGRGVRYALVIDARRCTR